MKKNWLWFITRVAYCVYWQYFSSLAHLQIDNEENDINKKADTFLSGLGTSQDTAFLFLLSAHHQMIFFCSKDIFLVNYFLLLLFLSTLLLLLLLLLSLKKKKLSYHEVVLKMIFFTAWNRFFIYFSTLCHDYAIKCSTKLEI